MNIDIYSDRAKQAIQSAQSLALARRHQQLAPEHILKVLLEERDGLSRALIQSAGGRPEEVDKAVEATLSRTPKVEGGSGQLYMKPETARVFAEAEQGAKTAGDAFVTTERLLIAIAAEGGEAAKALKDAGANPAALDLRRLEEQGFDAGLDNGGLTAGALDQCAGEAVLFFEEDLEQVLGAQLLVAAGQGQGLGRLDRLLGAIGIELDVHSHPS